MYMLYEIIFLLFCSAFSIKNSNCCLEKPYKSVLQITSYNEKSSCGSPSCFAQSYRKYGLMSETLDNEHPDFPDIGQTAAI